MIDNEHCANTFDIKLLRYKLITSFHCTIARLISTMTDITTICEVSAYLISAHRGPSAPQEIDLHKH